jgi:hypothetical protein
MRLGPSVNVQSRLATRARPIAARDLSSVPAFPARSCRKVTTEEQADHADDDDRGFDDTSGHEAKRGAFVLALDHRKQRDGGANARAGVDQIEEATPEHAGVRARALHIAATGPMVRRSADPAIMAVMDVAELVLGFVRALVWPALVLGLAVAFRRARPRLITSSLCVAGLIILIPGERSHRAPTRDGKPRSGSSRPAKPAPGRPGAPDSSWTQGRPRCRCLSERLLRRVKSAEVVYEF